MERIFEEMWKNWELSGNMSGRNLNKRSGPVTRSFPNRVFCSFSCFFKFQPDFQSYEETGNERSRDKLGKGKDVATWMNLGRNMEVTVKTEQKDTWKELRGTGQEHMKEIRNFQDHIASSSQDPLKSLSSFFKRLFLSYFQVWVPPKFLQLTSHSSWHVSC